MISGWAIVAVGHVGYLLYVAIAGQMREVPVIIITLTCVNIATYTLPYLYLSGFSKVRNSTTFSNTLIITKISNKFELQFHLLLKIVTELSEHFTSCLHSLLKLVTLLHNGLNVTRNSNIFSN